MVLETSILPWTYAPKWWWGTDSNRRTQRERIYSPPRLATSLPHHFKIVICGALLRQPLLFCQSRTEVRSFLLSFVSLFCLHLPILMEMWIFFSLCFAQRNCDMRRISASTALVLSVTY